MKIEQNVTKKKLTKKFIKNLQKKSKKDYLLRKYIKEFWQTLYANRSQI